MEVPRLGVLACGATEGHLPCFLCPHCLPVVLCVQGGRGPPGGWEGQCGLENPPQGLRHTVSLPLRP